MKRLRSIASNLHSIYLFTNFPGRDKLLPFFIASNFIIAFLELVGLAFIAAFITEYLSDSNSISLFSLTIESSSTALIVLVVFWIIRSIVLSRLYLFNNEFIQFLKSGLQFNQLNIGFGYKGRSLEKEAGKLFNSLTNEAQIITGQLLIPIFTIIPEVLLIILFFSYALYVFPKAILVSILVLTIGLLISQAIISPFNKKYGRLRLKLDTSWTESVVNTFTNKPEAETYGVLDNMIFNLHSDIQQSNYNTGRFLALKPINKSLLELFGVFSIIALLVISSSSNDAREDLLFIILTLLRTLPSFNKFMLVVQSYKFASPVIDKQLRYLSRSFKNIEVPVSFSQGIIEYKCMPNIIPSSISIDTNKNGLIVITGDSGLGKTVALQSIVESLTSINARINTAEKIKFSYSSQSNLILDSNVLYNINFYREKDETRKRIAFSYLKQCGFDDALLENNVSCINFSGGQKRRISVVRALADDNDLIFLDEPTASLDIESAKDMIKILNILSISTTIVIVSHDTTLINEATELVVLRKKNPQ